MKFKSYINETELEDTDIPYLIDFIKKNCKNYLKKSKGELMFRGMRMVSPVVIKKPRKNRRPKDMDPKIHKLLDKAFKNVFGWKARSEGTFATGESMWLDRYGPTYYIFPIKIFTFLWSPYIEDLLDEMPGAIEDQINPWEFPDESKEYFEWKKEFNAKGGLKEKHLDLFEKFVRENYQETNLYKAIYSKNEIMLRCREYLAITTAGEKGRKFRDAFTKKFSFY